MTTEIINQVLDWRLICAFVILGVLLILNYQATNNIAKSFKSKEHKTKMIIININGGLVAIILLLSRVTDMMQTLK